MISFEDFQEIDLRVGTITDVEDITDADKLLLLHINIGEEDRQVVAGIKQSVTNLDDLIDKQVVMVANLEPKEMFDYKSEGMILAARGDEPVLISPQSSVSNGSTVQ